MSSLKILIVEDEAVVAEDMRIMLQKIGYEVVGTALDYEEALEMLEANRPELVLVDIQLGGLKDGIQLAEFIRDTYQLPFMFVTSNADEFTVRRARALQPVGYVVKPFDNRDLYAAIEMAREHFNKKSDELPDELLMKDTLYVKQNDEFKRVLIREIVWLKADGNYTDLHTLNERFVVRGKVKELLETLSTTFVRIHKSYAVNVAFIEKLSQDYVHVPNERLPVSKTYKGSLHERLQLLS